MEISSRLWDQSSIATELWKHQGMLVSEETQKNVNFANDYLEKYGYELKGVEGDGNCFFYAFYQSYLTVKAQRSIPILDFQQSPISYLREILAGCFRDGTRQYEIKNDKEWVTINEGKKLGSFFKIPIRVLTPQPLGKVFDLLENENDDAVEWEHIPEDQKPKAFIFIVDLGGHFVYAAPKSTPIAAPKSTPLKYRILQLLILVGAAFILYHIIAPRIFKAPR